MNACIRVLRRRGGNGPRQVLDIGLDIVVTDLQGRLRLVFIADVAHPQRSRIQQIERVAVDFLEVMFPVADKRTTQSRGGAEQVGYQPAVALEVARQAEIVLVTKGL